MTNQIRAEAVNLAKALGICTQCKKHKAKEGFLQCERCILTNRKKWQRRKAMGELTYSQQLTQKSLKAGLCTKCHKNKAKKHMKQCVVCLEKDKLRQRAKGVKVKNMCKCGKAPKEENRSMCEPCLEQSRAWARKKYHAKKGRKKAFANKDEVPKRSYNRRVHTAPIQMQSMINELEMFIAKLPTMTASEYLEARVNLINSILIRGK